MTDTPSPKTGAAPKRPAAAPARKPAAAPAAVVKKPASPAKPSPARTLRDLFAGETINADIVDERVEKARIRKVMRVVQLQVVLISGMVLFFMLGGSFFQPVYEYYAMDTEHHQLRLLPLTMPNMTNLAVLSWATDSITEIMTFGFGDYLPHLREQQPRFTKEGWEGFVSGFDKMNIGQLFRERQLVLTTVPSDTAVIVSQGPTLDNGYEWKIQVPVVMTYATNDNVTHRDKALIVLVVTRVPPSQAPIGIAIKSWTVG